MTTLEKILQEIEHHAIEFEAFGFCDDYISVGWIKDIIKKHLSCENETTRQPRDDGWIPCSERMPECEQEVYIFTERGTETTALYEDGKMPESKSKWHWNDIQGEWDDEEDCMIVPEGWWEYRHFNPDDVYNNVVDEKVIAWRPLPEKYQPKDGEKI